MDTSIQDTPCGTPSTSELNLPQGSRVGRKRAREVFKDEDVLDDQFDINDDGRPKTRRVNPQRLALRLGPELVAEMEALIIPGAKMPNFTVRKDFQERYCVDRRHIYDYFHSRGLRVSKEDKHTNLIRGRAMKAAAAAAAAAAASIPCEAAPFETRGAQLDLNNLNQPLAMEPGKPKIKQPLKAYKKKKLESVTSRRSFLATASGTISRESSLSLISEPSFSASSSSSGKLGWNAQETSGYSISDTQSMLSTPPHNSPAIEVIIAKEEPFDYMPLPSAIGSPLSPLLVPGCSGILDSEYFSLCVDAEAPRADDTSLDKGARAELYNLIQNSLHTGTTLGHSTGSHDWTLLSGRLATFNTAGSHYRPNKDGSTNPLVFDYSSGVFGEVSPDLFDLRGWLSEDLTREEGLFPQITQPSAPPGLSFGTRSVYLARHDGYSEPGQTNVKEHVLHSRAQKRTRTASARGQI